MIQTEVVTDKKSYVAAGTLFGKEFLRLVRLGPYRLDAHFDGNLFIFTHRDVPGLIGFIGNDLRPPRREHRPDERRPRARVPGGEAIGVVNLDSIPPESALEEVRAHPDVISVSLVKLPKPGELPPWLSSD